MRLKTKYNIGKIPHSEHPCPQSMRKNWLCLNGEWDFYKENEAGEKSYEGKILVPFSPETLHSGIAEDFVLNSGERIVYTRVIHVEKDMMLGCTLLHFGAVDSECKVYLNGVKVGCHVGGFTAFTVNLSDCIQEGDNQLTVVCTDEATRNGGARGRKADIANAYAAAPMVADNTMQMISAMISTFMVTYFGWGAYALPEPVLL